MDRRVVAAILLMMLVAVAPAVLFKRPTPPPGAVQVDSAGAPAPAAALPANPLPLVPADPAAILPEVEPALAPDTITVRSPLYEYRFSTRGGRLVSAALSEYRSMLPADSGKVAQILQPGSNLLASSLVVGGDTVALGAEILQPSQRELDVSAGETSFTLSGTVRGLAVLLTYRFVPGSYHIAVEGRVEGVGPNGAQLLIGMGPGLRNTESDSVEHRRELGVVVKAEDSELHRFQSVDQGEPLLLSGPFEWVAVKSKYFVAAVFAMDSTQPAGARGRLSGARAFHADPLSAKPALVDVEASLPVGSDGSFHYLVYAGPMEYPRLNALGNEFDDVNPYGWPGFRSLIRPVALGARWLLVWMHENLGFAYGLVLITFGVMIRLLLWPLNQKAMRSSMEMQAIQPIMKEMQEKYKNDPQKLQQEMFKLYKEHNVNPLGGCWPMLLPWPVMLALFFVFQNTIELRGESFLWMPDLARADPLFITPILMGLSMFGLMKLGQRGMAANPQMKMMLYIMPPMMTFLFIQFASGLNLYYFVSNMASIPQQWLLTQERLRRNPPTAVAPAPKSGKRK
ncbi:MAG: membrane protein insertase YidC [Gemmatimonadota bacterium]|nr:membrane protein insertase YidC [Gemmatimonadota bacterium]